MIIWTTHTCMPLHTIAFRVERILPWHPIEDMRQAVASLMNDMRVNNINQGGSSENTYDAIGKFFTDDLIDWDRDGILDDVEWSTSVGPHRLDLSAYTHRIVVVLGDEMSGGRVRSSSSCTSYGSSIWNGIHYRSGP